MVMIREAVDAAARRRAGAGCRSAGHGAEKDDRGGAAGARARDDAEACCRAISARRRLPRAQGPGTRKAAAGQ